MMNKTLRILALSGLLAGCTPQWAVRDADLQVSDILRDREQTTLGYKPDVEVAGEIPPRPEKRAYQKIPFSPKPPPTTSPIEPVAVELRCEPAGPESFWMDLPADSGELPQLEWMSAGALSAEGPPLPDNLVRRFDFFRCLSFAVQNSRQYQTEMESLYLKALNVTLQRHLFDARPFVRQTEKITSTPSVSGSGGQRVVEHNAALKAITSAGVRQRLPYGGEISAEALVDFVSALRNNVEEGESASLTLRASVPLLRGAGMVNLEPLIRSEREIVYQIRAFEDFRRNFVVSIASQYFNLLTRQQAMTNRRLQLASYTLLVERTRALHQSSKLNFLEVQRAEQSRLQAENALIVAERDYRSAIDDFKITIGMPVDWNLDVVPAELDTVPPRLDDDQAIELARQYRLSLRTAADRIEDAQRDVRNAANGLLPGLNIDAGATSANLDGTPARSLNEDRNTYDLGVTLDLPVDRVAERNAYRAALIDLHRARRAFTAEEDRIIADVRDAIRAIQAAQVTVVLQKRGIDIAQKRVEYAYDLMKLGRGGNRDIIDAQVALLEAQDAYAVAKSQLQIRILEYMRDTGTLRIDPEAGAIGRAMQRQKMESTQADLRQ